MVMAVGDLKRGVVAFTLYGDQPLYNAGALRQAELFQAYSRQGRVRWELRYYTGDSVPMDLRNRLEDLGARIFPMREQAEDRTASFWRYHALRSNYDFYLFRDVDTRLGEREQWAIDAFVDSGAEFHVMRDHPRHLAPMLPGLWGCNRAGRDRVLPRLPIVPPPQFFAQVNRWLRSQHASNDFTRVDQIWLWRQVWPLVRRRALIHSALATSRFHGRYKTHPFPSTRRPGEFVGKSLNQYEQENHPVLSQEIDDLAWLETGRLRSRAPVRPADKVCVKLACGIGNNIFQILAGLALARRLSDRTGTAHRCEILLPDAVDLTSDYSVYETIGGHLRGDLHYSREHQDFRLPNPADLPAIFPNLVWRDLTAPRPLYPGDLSEMISARYFDTARYGEVSGDPRFADPVHPYQSRVVNCHFISTIHPFWMDCWYPEVLSVRHCFEPGAEVSHYLRCKYGLSADADTALVGVHIRNDLRIPDIHRTDAVTLEWRLDCVEQAAQSAGPSAPILVVSNQVASNPESGSACDVLLAELRRRYPGRRIITSRREPYYLDFFLLRLCTHTVASCSTFSFCAGLTSPRLQRLYVPNSYSDRHFMDGIFPDFCAFLPDRV